MPWRNENDCLDAAQMSLSDKFTPQSDKLCDFVLN